MATKSGIDIRMERMPDEAQLKALFDVTPKLKQYQVLDTVLASGAAPIIKKAIQLTPKSSETGTADKRSAKQKAAANWQIPLWKTIAKVTRKYGAKFGIVVIGPKWPEGNKAYFNTSPKGRRVWYWGKDSGKTKSQVRNWIVQAADETLSEQDKAMEKTIKRLVRKMMKAQS